jgi:glutaredoxin
MEFIEPIKNSVTIYTKSGCKYCTNVKQLLQENNIKYEVVDCDEYIIKDKEKFLNFIKKYTKKDYKTFPMVFNDTKFIGGYNETMEKVNKILNFDDNFDFL